MNARFKKMRVTKVMKEHTIRELDAARYAANKADAAEYNKKQKNCLEAIRSYLDTVVNPTVKEILKSYGMDNDTTKKYGDDIPVVKAILPIYDQYIKNDTISEELNRRARDRQTKQMQMVENFILQCDLGADKEQFFAMIEDMKEEMAAI